MAVKLPSYLFDFQIILWFLFPFTIWQASADETKVVVIGGYNSYDLGGPLDDVEVVDLATPEANECAPLPVYPTQSYSLTSAVYGGKILSCGGYVTEPSLDRTDECHEYDPGLQSWLPMSSMLVERDAHASSLVGGEWLISGGFNGRNSTESWNGVAFNLRSSMPIEMHNHCQVTLNSSHVFFADATVTGQAFLLNWYDQTWTQVTSVPNIRYRPACGSAYSAATGLVVVVAGDGTSDVFSLNNGFWTPGPPLGDDAAGNGPIAAQLQSTFLVMGGFPGGDDNLQPLDEIYKYDVEANEFELLPQRLQTARGLATAVAVPDDFVNC